MSSCHKTCFSLQLDGTTLDNFAELKTVEGLKEDSLIKVVQEPYIMHEARIHVRYGRDLLKSSDPADAYNVVDCSFLSLSFLNTVGFIFLPHLILSELPPIIMSYSLLHRS